MSNSLELLGVSSGSKLYAYGTIVVLGGLRVNNTLVAICIKDYVEPKRYMHVDTYM